MNATQVNFIEKEFVKTKLLPLLILVLLNVHQVNILLFAHVHYVNGIAVVHSHPNAGTHSHSEGGGSFIVSLSHFYSLKPDGALKLICDTYLLHIFGHAHEFLFCEEIHLKFPSLRGPPCSPHLATC